MLRDAGFLLSAGRHLKTGYLMSEVSTFQGKQTFLVCVSQLNIATYLLNLHVAFYSET